MVKIKETISAFIDEEANEVETHRFLRAMKQEIKDRDAYDSDIGEQSSLISSLLNFMSIRTVLSKQLKLKGMSVADHELLFHRIRAAIEKEPVAQDLSSGASLRSSAVGLAIAASLVVIVTFLMFNLSKTESIEVVGSDSVNQTSGDREVEAELRDLDIERQRHLREYLNEHDRIMRTKRTSQFVTNEK